MEPVTSKATMIGTEAGWCSLSQASRAVTPRGSISGSMERVPRKISPAGVAARDRLTLS